MKDTRAIKQIKIDHKDRQQALTKNSKRDYENRQKAKNSKRKVSDKRSTKQPAIIYN